MNARDRFTQIMTEIGDLKGDTADPGKASRMGELIVEAKGLKATIESENDAEGLAQWAGTSAGRVSLASGKRDGADLIGFTPAGATELTTGKSNQQILAEEYGEGIVDGPMRQKINSPEFKKAFRSYVRSGGVIERMDAKAYRTINEASDSAGGYLVPEDLSSMIITRDPTPTRVAGRVTQLTTSRDMLGIPRVNYSTDDKYTTGVRVSWSGGENNQSALTHRTTDPVFGRTQIPIFTAMLSLAVSNDMIEDSAFPILSFISDKFGETVDLVREDMTINGIGVSQPTGIIAKAGAAWSNAGSPEDTILYVPSTTAGSIGTGGAAGTAFPGLTKAAMSIPEQYDANSVWVFNKQSTGLALSGLVDGNGRPLWGMGLQDAGLEPGYANRQLVGYPTIYSAFMPNIAANAFPMVFGDLKGYFLINRVGFSIQILRERYAEENQVVILGRLRFGGMPVEPWKLRLYKAAAS